MVAFINNDTLQRTMNDDASCLQTSFSMSLPSYSGLYSNSIHCSSCFSQQVQSYDILQPASPQMLRGWPTPRPTCPCLVTKGFTLVVPVHSCMASNTKIIVLCIVFKMVDSNGCYVFGTGSKVALSIMHSLHTCKIA